MRPFEIERERERLSTSVSVGLRLGYRQTPAEYPGLVLCTRRETNQLGLIAGGIEENEDPFQAVMREAEEEANLPGYAFILQNTRPMVIFSPKAGRTSVGLIFDAEMAEPISLDGYIPNSPEIKLVKPYSPDELISLYRKPEIWYRPEFNLVAVEQWLVSFARWKYGAWEGKDFEDQVLSAWGLKKHCKK